MKTVARPVLEHLPRISLAVIRRAPGQRVRIGQFIATAYHGHVEVNGQRIELCTTVQYRGVRTWFACPDCGHPRSFLYVLNAGEPVTCRTCLDGTYEFNNLFYRHGKDDHVARRIRRKFAVRTRTPYDRDAQTFPPRPEWFPVAVYDRMRGNHDELIERARIGYGEEALRKGEITRAPKRKTPPRTLVRAGKYDPDARRIREAKRAAERDAAIAAEISAREKSDRAIVAQQRERMRRPQYPIDPRG